MGGVDPKGARGKMDAEAMGEEGIQKCGGGVNPEVRWGK